jgi:hypothetical protein
MARDILVNALNESDLKLAIKTIHAALGITGTDRANYEFSVADSRVYAGMAPDERAEFIASWLRGELMDAGERAAKAMIDERVTA